MPPISFKANYLKTVTIPCRSSQNEDVPKEASVVEFDKSDENDLRSLSDVADLWDDKSSTFAYPIYMEAKDKTAPEAHYIGLTLQNSDYNKINPQKVLGLAVFDEKDAPENQLGWLQVDPSNNFSDSLSNRSCKNVGTTLIDYVKERYSNKPIFVNSTLSAIDFYKKNGFENKQGCQDSQLIWQG